MAALGGVRDAKEIENSVEIEELARFAVEEYDKKANALLEFVRVVKVKEQVVAGIVYYITIEVIDGGKKKLYEAKVWVKPWMKFKELQEFSPLGDCSSEGETPKDAAVHAVKSIQRMPNSLIPYQPFEALSAKAKKTENSAKFDLLLKVERGQNVEKFMVQVDETFESDEAAGFRLWYLLRYTCMMDYPIKCSTLVCKTYLTPLP